MSKNSSSGWSVLEALEQARAALPDISMVTDVKIRNVLKGMGESIDQAQKGNASYPQLYDALVDARKILPACWADFGGVSGELLQKIDDVLVLEKTLLDHPEVHVEQAKDGKWQFRHDNNEQGPDHDYFRAGVYASRADAAMAAFAEYDVELPGVGQKEVDVEQKNQIASEQAQVVTKGEYHGSVVDVKNGLVYQDAGRGNIVRHDLKSFEEPPEIGQKLDLKYVKGVMKVMEALSHDQHSVSVSMTR